MVAPVAVVSGAAVTFTSFIPPALGWSTIWYDCTESRRPSRVIAQPSGPGTVLGCTLIDVFWSQHAPTPTPTACGALGSTIVTA